MAYIIDSYNKWDQWDRNHAVYKFEINENWYAIFQVELEWGLPQLPMRIGAEKNPQEYFVHATEEDAMRYVKQLRHANY